MTANVFPSNLSPYEVRRQINMENNNKVMASLGLPQAKVIMATTTCQTTIPFDSPSALVADDDEAYVPPSDSESQHMQRTAQIVTRASNKTRRVGNEAEEDESNDAEDESHASLREASTSQQTPLPRRCCISSRAQSGDQLTFTDVATWSKNLDGTFSFELKVALCVVGSWALMMWESPKAVPYLSLGRIESVADANTQHTFTVQEWRVKRPATQYNQDCLTGTWMKHAYTELWKHENVLMYCSLVHTKKKGVLSKTQGTLPLTVLARFAETEWAQILNPAKTPSSQHNKTLESAEVRKEHETEAKDIRGFGDFDDKARGLWARCEVVDSKPEDTLSGCSGWELLGTYILYKIVCRVSENARIICVCRSFVSILHRQVGLGPTWSSR